MVGRNQSQSAWEVIESDVYPVGMRWSSIEVKYAESYWSLIGGTRFAYRDREILVEDGKLWDVTGGQRVHVGWRASKLVTLDKPSGAERHGCMFTLRHDWGTTLAYDTGCGLVFQKRRGDVLPECCPFCGLPLG